MICLMKANKPFEFLGIEVTVEYVYNASVDADTSAAVRVSLIKDDESLEVTQSCTTMAYLPIAVPSMAYDEKLVFTYDQERRIEFALVSENATVIGRYMLSLSRFSPERRVLAACMTLKDNNGAVTDFCLNVKVKMTYERPAYSGVRPPAPLSSILGSRFKSLHVNVLQFKLGNQYRITPSEGAYVSLSLRETTLRTPIQDDFIFNSAFEFPYSGEPVFRVAVHFTDKSKVDRRVLFYKIDLESLSRTNRMFDLQAKPANATGANKSSAVRGSLVMHLCLSPAPSRCPQVFPLIERPFTPTPGGPSLWASGESPAEMLVSTSSSAISTPPTNHTTAESPQRFTFSGMSLSSKDFLANEAQALRSGFTIVDVGSIEKMSTPSEWSPELRYEALENVLGRIGSMVVVVYQLSFEEGIPTEVDSGETAVEVAIGQHSIKIQVPPVSNGVALLNRAFLFPFKSERYFYCGLTGAYKEDGFLDLRRFLCGEKGNVLACSVPLRELKGRVYVRLEKRETATSAMTDLTATWDSF